MPTDIISVEHLRRITSSNTTSSLVAKKLNSGKFAPYEIVEADRQLDEEAEWSGKPATFTDIRHLTPCKCEEGWCGHDEQEKAEEVEEASEGVQEERIW